MKHYICLGGCKGVSSNPGVCNAPDCKNHSHALVECNCTDGLHGDFKSKEIKKDFNGFMAFVMLILASVASYLITLPIVLAIFPARDELGGLIYLFYPLPIVLIVFFGGLIYLLFSLNKSRSNNVDLKNDLSASSDMKLTPPKKVSYFEKFLSITMLIVNVALCIYYLIPFAKYYKYVESFSGKYNEAIYGLKYLSPNDIFVRNGIVLFILVFLSFLTIIKGFKNSKSFTNLLIITILFTSYTAFTFPYHGFYFNTVYQDGSAYNGGAIDISKTIKAIEERDTSKCREINYYAYKDYCIREIIKNTNNYPD